MIAMSRHRERRLLAFFLLVPFSCAFVGIAEPRARPSTRPTRVVLASLHDNFKSRRDFFRLLPWISLMPQAVLARGLVQFPCDKPLLNTYHLMRAGTSLLEEQDIWSTNPLFLTNREDALAAAGQEQVVLACKQLQAMTTLPTVVKYSLAASAIDTANIVGRELKLGRDRLVPEFTFMDPRAIGQWDMTSRQETLPAVWAMDVDEAGEVGLGGRPPPNEDSTPNETLADQAVRLRQLLSVLESQYSGDTILLVYPDGTGPALLSAMIAGIPYNRVHELEYASGEVRLDVTKDSTLALWKEKQENSAYNELVQRGREKLVALRATDEIVNRKDQIMEEERLAVEKTFKAKQAERQRRNEEELEKELQERKRQLAERESNGSMSPVALASIALAAVGGAAALTMNSPEDSTVKGKENENEETLLQVDNADMTSSATLPLETASSPRSLTVSSPGMLKVNGDSDFSMVDPDPRMDPYEAAQRAMDEYMERDDGGEDWLKTLAEIREETDDPDYFQ